MPASSLFARLKARARAMKREVYAIYLAARDPETPWYAKILAAGIAAYALSPIDLIPDFIPVLGYLDDLLIVPAGIALVLRLVPAPVMDRCRARAEAELAGKKLVSKGAAVAVVALWLLAAALVLLAVLK
jgi:uncharacterized membrane protein YkvA (DUF1232 family)